MYGIGNWNWIILLHNGDSRTIAPHSTILIAHLLTKVSPLELIEQVVGFLF
jgi:hypothetical protein